MVTQTECRPCYPEHISDRLRAKKKEAVEMLSSMADYEMVKRVSSKSLGLTDVAAKIAAAKLKLTEAKLKHSDKEPDPQILQKARSTMQDVRSAILAKLEEMHSSALVMAENMRANIDKMQKQKGWSKEHRDQVEKEFDKVMLQPVKILEKAKQELLANKAPEELTELPTEEGQMQAAHRLISLMEIAQPE